MLTRQFRCGAWLLLGCALGAGAVPPREVVSVQAQSVTSRAVLLLVRGQTTVGAVVQALQGNGFEIAVDRREAERPICVWAPGPVSEECMVRGLREVTGLGERRVDSIRFLSYLACFSPPTHLGEPERARLHERRKATWARIADKYQPVVERFSRTHPQIPFPGAKLLQPWQATAAELRWSERVFVQALFRDQQGDEGLLSALEEGQYQVAYEPGVSLGLVHLQPRDLGKLKGNLLGHGHLVAAMRQRSIDPSAVGTTYVGDLGGRGGELLGLLSRCASPSLFWIRGAVYVRTAAPNAPLVEANASSGMAGG